jgi:DNA-binding NarL/FixJ family response regulator
VTGRLLVAPGHRVEAQCIVLVLCAAGLPATAESGTRDVEAVVAVVPRDLSITATLDKIKRGQPQVPILLLTSLFDEDTALVSARAAQLGVAAVISLECAADVLATSARRLLEGYRPPWHDGDGGSATLTAREHEVFALLAAGQRNHEIADQLGISSHTVRTHVQHVLTKLDVHHRQAAAVAQSRLLSEKDRRRPASPRPGMSR